MKTCCKCKQAKPLNEFHKDKNRKDGLTPACKPCRASDPVKNRARAKAWQMANPERARAKAKAYREKNPEKCSAARTEWRKANKERANEHAYRWQKKNPEKFKELSAAWRKANKEKVRTYTRNRRAKKSAVGTLSPDIAVRLFVLQRGKCPCCGQPLGDDYHVDHIQPISRGGSNTDDNVQLLRKGCNLKKQAKHPIDYMQEQGFLL